MLTGQGNEAIAVQAMSGAQDYLVKGNMTSPSCHPQCCRTAHLLWQLERSEERFALPLKICWIVLAYTSVRDQSGRIIDFSIEYVNAAACTNKGMTQSEQIGRLLEIVAQLRSWLFEEYCQVVETGEPLLKKHSRR